MNTLKLAAAAIALSATPAFAQETAEAPAQAASQVVAGATVTGPQGNVVGTIESVANGEAILDTGKHKVPLAVSMYGQGEAGPTVTVTKAQLDSMVDAQIAEANAARDAALVEGATVVAADNAALGTILEVDGNNIVIARGGDEADKVTLLREYFAMSDAGLMARLTNAQIDEAMSAQGETTGE
ncbi:hypothetical protein [Qipengyuania sp. MTN3-11]|uniref:hypothetical protein n=1 Tax=Qipengyuania sp. MTN3-11 TaxID=3056557 RepID=UPI0036F1A7FC